jgi:acyl-CoA thioester hydrolase
MTTKRFKVHYHQVDQMGLMHHAQYLYVLEQARIDWLQNQNISYALMEKSGILLPVADLSIRYKRPLHFDDTFFVHTFLDKIERSFVTFSYVIEDEQQKLFARAKTRLVFVSEQTRKAISCPQHLQKVFLP